MTSNLPSTTATTLVTQEHRPFDRTQSSADGDIARLHLAPSLLAETIPSGQ